MRAKPFIMKSRLRPPISFVSLILLMAFEMPAVAAPPRSFPDHADVLAAFNKSYQQITPKTIAFWDSTFLAIGIHDDPFAMGIFYIRHFTRPTIKTGEGLFTLNDIVTKNKSNVLSNCIALVALMQAQKWDVECFYASEEFYLGINLGDDWQVRKGNWVEMDGKKYYLKEFDDSTAVGEIQIEKPAARYKSLRAKRYDLRPFPLVDTLPVFNSQLSVSRWLEWKYDFADHELTVLIPREQIAWTKNLPASISGMIHAGFGELRNMGLDGQLRVLVESASEYEQVNFLMKFCQSQASFKYLPGLPIRSVTRQIWEGINDCDGRSVLLCCLLHTVLDYPLENIVFISWENHLALGVKPRSPECLDILRADGNFVGENFFILDAAYLGATHWGNKMKNLSEKYDIITLR